MTTATTSQRESHTGGRRPDSITEWISVPELATRIGVSAEACYRLARAGNLPATVRLGRRYVVNYSAFVELSSSPMTEAA